MGVGGALHLDIVYDLHHSFFRIRFLCVKGADQGNQGHAKSQQAANDLDLFFFCPSFNTQDHPPPDTFPDHPDISR